MYATIVGVMPEGFAFPITHRLRLPLRADPAATSGEAVLNVFGRLSPGVTIEKAQAELTTAGMRADPSELAARQQLRPVVEPYARAFGLSLDVPPQVRPLFYAINLFFVTLEVLISANVALLMFARAVTREGEIVVRNALGASRGRIVMQLFAEALVLGAVAALIGLGVAHFSLGEFHHVSEIQTEGRLPFWYLARVSLTRGASRRNDDDIRAQSGNAHFGQTDGGFTANGVRGEKHYRGKNQAHHTVHEGTPST